MLRHYKALSLCAAVAAAAVSVAVAAVPAFAQSRPVVVSAQREDPTRLVGYRDLNLANYQDRKLLLRRVDAAVGEVCAEASVTLDEFGHSAACHAFALDDARPQIAQAISRARSSMAANGSVTSLAGAAIIVSTPAG